MSSTAILIFTALVMGAQHTLAPDHVAAVSVFASRNPSWRTALGVGARWGLGHSITIIALGTLLVWTGAHFPTSWEAMMERLVGVVLVVLGAAGIRRAMRAHWHWHEHDGVRHAHPHAKGGGAHGRDHAAVLGIGMLHGVAGTGALVIAIPVATGASPGHSLMFLASFGVGTIVAMSAIAALAGAAFARAALRSERAQRMLIGAAGALSVIVGVLWFAAAGGA